MKSCISCGSTLPGGNEKFCPYCGSNLSKSNLSKQAKSTEGVVVVDCSLKTDLGYEEATTVRFDNPYAVRVSNASLDFHPYHVFGYTLNVQRRDPNGEKHRIHLQDIHVVDAFDGILISAKQDAGLKERITGFFTKTTRRNSEKLEFNRNENDQIIKDLTKIKPVYDYSIPWALDYNVNIIDDKISLKAAEKAVLQQIKQDNTVYVSYKAKTRNGKTEQREMKIIPTYDEIMINTKHTIYVPKWIITFKAGETSYERKILATSGTVVVDEIALCPKHFSLGKLWTTKRETHAVCEICGYAYCLDHIFKIGISYYCDEHRSYNIRDESVQV